LTDRSRPESLGKTELKETVARRLSTIKEQVAKILEKYPDARNSDPYLIILWLREYGGLSVKLPFIPESDLPKLRFETVRRARCLLNLEGKYLATEPRVIRMRARLSKVYRELLTAE